MFGFKLDLGQMAADCVEHELLMQIGNVVHYTDADIVKLLEAITSLAKDGITYRTQPNSDIGKQLTSTSKVLTFAQDFIRNKGLADEFNEYCFKRDK